jgi:hypothetical protein
MKRSSRKKQQRLVDVALRGAAAGVIGGAVVSLTQRELLSRLAGGAPHQAGWDDVAGRGLRRVGIDVDGNAKIAVGIAGQLLYSAALGACYALMRERAKQSRAGSVLTDAALTYAASLVFPDRPTPKRRGRKLAARKALVNRANPAQAFNRATSMALNVMMR